MDDHPPKVLLSLHLLAFCWVRTRLHTWTTFIWPLCINNMCHNVYIQMVEDYVVVFTHAKDKFVSQSSFAHHVAPFFSHLAWTKSKLHHKHELSPHKTLSRKSSQFILIFNLDPSWQKCPHFQDNTHTWTHEHILEKAFKKFILTKKYQYIPQDKNQ